MEQPDIARRYTARGAATRASIVDAAANLVRERGAAGTGLEAVMERSGVSKSQLYHYFASKDDLITAVVERQAEMVLAANEPLLRNMDSLAGLKRWRDVMVEGCAAESGTAGCPLGSLVGELAGRPKQRAALVAGFLRWGNYLRDGFERMKLNGELPQTVDTESLATACLAALQGGLLLAQTTRSVKPLVSALDMAVEHVIRQ